MSNKTVQVEALQQPLLKAISETNELKRLKEIQQLGGVGYVFKQASHNRYDHSVGLCMLAGKLATHLRDRCPQYNITDKDILCVQIAGLCYSVGHGPFSHLYYNRIIEDIKEKQKDQIKFKTQIEASCAILETIFMDTNVKKEFKAAGFSEEDVKFIQALIKGEPQKGLRPPEKDFLYEVVHNTYNGIDVKLWDYLQSDTDAIGDTKVTYEWKKPDYSKLLETARVADVEDYNSNIKQSHIVYHHEALSEIQQLFRVKEMLHRRIYQHSEANAVEIMISDALLETQLVQNAAKDVTKFLALTDQAALDEASTELQKPAEDASFNSMIRNNLKKQSALKLLQKVQNRQTYNPQEGYTCVAETSILVKKSEMEKTMKSLKTHLNCALKSICIYPRELIVDVVEYKETLDPRKVWLYKDDYTPFAMSSLKEKAFTLRNPITSLYKAWGNVPHYDTKTKEWYFPTEESFETDHLKLFEYKEYAECSIRLYSTDHNPPRNLQKWTEEKCKYFMIKEELCLTTKESITVPIVLCVLAQAVTTFSIPYGIISGVCTYLASWGSLWLRDNLQKNKQKLNYSSDSINKAVGGIFVTAVATISSYALPKKGSFQRKWYPKKVMIHDRAVMISKLDCESKTAGSTAANGIKRMTTAMTFGIQNRAYRGIIGVIIGSVCVAFQEHGTLPLNISLAGGKYD